MCTHSHLCNESRINYTRLNIDMCNVTHVSNHVSKDVSNHSERPYLGYEVVMYEFCVTWRLHMCEMNVFHMLTHSYLWDASDECLSYADAFISLRCLRCLIDMLEIIHWAIWRMSSLSYMTHVTCARRWHRYITCARRWHRYGDSIDASTRESRHIVMTHA